MKNSLDYIENGLDCCEWTSALLNLLPWLWLVAVVLGIVLVFLFLWEVKKRVNLRKKKKTRDIPS